LLPPNNLPNASKQGVKKLHPTDATQNLGLFLADQEAHNLSIVDYQDVLGYEGKPLGRGVRTDVERKAGDKLGLIVFGTFNTEEKFVQAAKAKDKDAKEDSFPRNPGAFALQTPYEQVSCIVADNCPARYVNDAKGVVGAKVNIQFVQHADPRLLYFDPMLGLHLLLQAQALCDIPAGDQLFTAYGDNWWEHGAPINRKEIDETELEDVGAPNDSDEDEHRVVFAHATPQKSQRPRNALTLSQDTPVSPLDSFVDTTAFLDMWEPPKTPKSSSSKKDKAKAKPAKSGGGKDIDLDELPQTSSVPAKRAKRSRRAVSPVPSPNEFYDSPTSDVEYVPPPTKKPRGKKAEAKQTATKSKEKNWEEAKSLSDEKEKLRAAEANSATKAKTPTPKKVAGYDCLSLYNFFFFSCVKITLLGIQHRKSAKLPSPGRRKAPT
jgi:hypothetical protein